MVRYLYNLLFWEIDTRAGSGDWRPGHLRGNLLVIFSSMLRDWCARMEHFFVIHWERIILGRYIDYEVDNKESNFLVTKRQMRIIIFIAIK